MRVMTRGEFEIFRKWMGMDERSLSDILEQAISHYQKHRKTDDAGQKFSYIFEMLTLRDHLFVYIYEPERINTTGIADYVHRLLNLTDVADYTGRELRDLVYVVNNIGKDITEGVFRECVAIMKAIHDNRTGTEVLK